jgi:hypothetical protein
MKCMGDFGEAYDSEEMGFKIKVKKPKWKVKVSVPKAVTKLVPKSLPIQKIVKALPKKLPVKVPKAIQKIHNNILKEVKRAPGNLTSQASKLAQQAMATVMKQKKPSQPTESVEVESDGVPVMDTAPATLIPSSSSVADAIQESAKKGPSPAVIGTTVAASAIGLFLLVKGLSA